MVNVECISDFTAQPELNLTFTYNGLPQNLVNEKTVKRFQRNLQLGLLQNGESGASEWQLLYSTGWKLLPRSKRDMLFLI